MIQEVIAAGMVPRTILISKDDADQMGLPKWTRQLFGLKVVIAWNIETTKVVPHIYDTVQMKFGKEEDDSKPVHLFGIDN
jgi:hypothetical protein